MSSNAPRPVEVVVVAVLAFIQAALELLGGVLMLAIGSTGLDTPVEGSTITPWMATTLGVISLVIGVITLIVGIGLLRGSRAARIVAIAVQVITVILAIVSLFLPGQQIWTEILNILVAITIVAMLSIRASRDFFAS